MKVRKEPGLLKALAVTIALLAIVPLPFALYLGGVEWTLKGPRAAPKEFYASYLVGIITFVFGLACIWIKDLCSRKSGR